MKSPKNKSSGEKLLIIKKKKNLIIWHYFNIYVHRCCENYVLTFFIPIFHFLIYFFNKFSNIQKKLAFNTFILLKT